jgi:hypothetical protein
MRCLHWAIVGETIVDPDHKIHPIVSPTVDPMIASIYSYFSFIDGSGMGFKDLELVETRFLFLKGIP